MVVGFLGNLARIAVTPAAGRLGDRYGMACVYKYSLIGILLNFAFYAVAVPSNALVMTVFGSIFSALGWSFAEIGLFGIQLYAQQVTNALEVCFLTGLILYLKFRVQKRERSIRNSVQLTQPTSAGCP